MLAFISVITVVFTALASSLVHSGQALLTYNQVKNHCEQKALDILVPQAMGLSALGKLNPTAEAIITTRRYIDRLIAAAPEAPTTLPLIVTRNELRSAQRQLARTQESIIKSAVSASEAIIRKPLPLRFRSKVNESFIPSRLGSRHTNEKNLLLHVRSQAGFENEIGPPLTLDPDFSDRQVAEGAMKIRFSNFLQRWRSIRDYKDVVTNCRAQVQMQSLEGTWQVRLVADKRSLN